MSYRLVSGGQRCDGSRTVRGTATPILVASALLKNFSSALHQNGLFTTAGPGERRVLEESAIERHVLRNAIDDHVVTARLALHDLVDADEFRLRFATALLIHPLDERRREGVFLTEEDSDFFHMLGLLGPKSPQITQIFADY